MGARVTVVGGGHGSARVIQALREEGHQLTVIVTTADDGGSSGELRRVSGGPAVGDLRRALVALSRDDDPLARAFAHPLDVRPVGPHPLGNLVIHSIAQAFDDLQAASDWLAKHLNASGQVLPATLEPVSLIAEAGQGVIEGESAIGSACETIRRLRFDPPRPQVSSRVRDAIADADWILLAPGSLFTSVLAVCALPDIASALELTPARVVWICNLAGQPGETAGMSALAHLRALRRHGVRIDTVIHDPEAEVHFTSAQLAHARLDGVSRRLQGTEPDSHEPELLRHVLHELFATRSPGAMRLAG
jgi:uncharacterized cofD-like protein